MNNTSRPIFFLTLAFICIWVILDNMFGSKHLENFLSNVFPFYKKDNTINKTGNYNYMETQPTNDDLQQIAQDENAPLNERIRASYNLKLDSSKIVSNALKNAKEYLSKTVGKNKVTMKGDV